LAISPDTVAGFIGRRGRAISMSSANLVASPCGSRTVLPENFVGYAPIAGMAANHPIADAGPAPERTAAFGISDGQFQRPKLGRVAVGVIASSELTASPETQQCSPAIRFRPVSAAQSDNRPSWRAKAEALEYRIFAALVCGSFAAGIWV